MTRMKRELLNRNCVRVFDDKLGELVASLTLVTPKHGVSDASSTGSTIGIYCIRSCSSGRPT